MYYFKKYKKGFTLSELIAVIVILSIIVSLSSVIYINVRKDTLEADYQNVKLFLEDVARKYASDTNITIVSVEDLIKAGYITPDDGSDIYDPRDKSSMNCYLIYTKFIDGEYISVLSEVDVGRDVNGKCSSYVSANNINICKAEVDNCETIDNDKWFNTNILLGINQGGIFLNENTAEFDWSSTSGDSSENATVKTDVSLLGQITYKCDVVTKDENNNDVNSTASKTIKIDMEKPIITDIKYNTNASEKKEVEIIASDGNGSGIKGYAFVSENNDCSEYKSINKFTVNQNGIYKACVIDNAGNIGEEKTVEIESILPGIPTIETRYGSKDGNVYNGEKYWSTQNIFVEIIAGENNTNNTKYQYKFQANGDWKTLDDKSGFLITDNVFDNYVYVRACYDNVCSKESNAKLVRIDKIKPTIYAKSSSNSATYGSSYVTSNYFTVSYSKSGGYVSCSPNNVSSMSTGTNIVYCTAYGNNGLSSSASTYVVVTVPTPSKPTIITYYGSTMRRYYGTKTDDSVYIYFYSSGATYYMYSYDGKNYTKSRLSYITRYAEMNGYIYVMACNSYDCSYANYARIWIEEEEEEDTYTGGNTGGSSSSGGSSSGSDSGSGSSSYISCNINKASWSVPCGITTLKSYSSCEGLYMIPKCATEKVYDFSYNNLPFDASGTMNLVGMTACDDTGNCSSASWKSKSGRCLSSSNPCSLTFRACISTGQCAEFKYKFYYEQ